MNEPLYAYCVTNEAHFLARLLKSIRHQQALDALAPPATPPRRLLVTNVPMTELEGEIIAFFKGRIEFCNPIVHDDLVNKDYFCLSKFRNACIAYARAQEEEWLFLCDCDTVLASYDFTPPPSKYGVPNVYWQKSETETIQQSLETIAEKGKAAFSVGNSWFILGRSIIEKFTFNENIYGWGWEDIEFDTRVKAAYFGLSVIDQVVIHVFHPEAHRVRDDYAFSRGKRILETTRTLLQFKLPPTEAHATGYFDIVAPEGSFSFLTFTCSGDGLHSKTGQRGIVSHTEEGSLKITWDDGAVRHYQASGEQFLSVDH
jgi:hypothetical protein